MYDLRDGLHDLGRVVQHPVLAVLLLVVVLGALHLAVQHLVDVVVERGQEDL